MKLTRRSFVYGAAGCVGISRKAIAQAPIPGAFPKADGLTLEVATFVGNMSYRDLPEDVIALGKKSILDGLGLALCGSVAERGSLSRAYVNSLGLTNYRASIIGSSLKAPCALRRIRKWHRHTRRWLRRHAARSRRGSRLGPSDAPDRAGPFGVSGIGRNTHSFWTRPDDRIKRRG